MAGRSALSATAEQKTALRGWARSENPRRSERARAILLTLSGWTSGRLAEVFGVTADSVRTGGNGSAREACRDDRRPGFKAALIRCRQLGANLVAARLDRITRRAHTLSQLLEDGYSVRAADMPGPDDLMMRIYTDTAQKGGS